MKKIFLLLTLIVCVVFGKAQQKGNVSGNVVDSTTKRPIEYATISLLEQGNKKVLNGTVTDKDGNFHLDDIPAGNYDLLIEFIGYHSSNLSHINVSGKGKETVIRPISLASIAVGLKTVVVTSQTKLVENKIDKFVYNAEKDISSQSGVATDILKKVPQVSVDIDGNVQLDGSGGVKFLINGKPSTAFGANVTDVLQAIPASQIKSIEVITNPGAKYDAAGLGGIINIILKTNKAKGYNGSISLSAGTRQDNGSFNLNYRKDEFGLNAFVSGNKRPITRPSFHSQRYSQDSIATSVLDQKGEFDLERHGIQTGAGFDWTFKKHNSFFGSISFNKFGSSNDGSNNQSFNAGNGVAPSLTYLLQNGKNSFSNTDLNFSYKRTFSKEDQELELSLNSSLERGQASSANYQYPQSKDSLIYGSRGNNPSHAKETEFTIDYTHPFSKAIKAGFGGK